MEKDVKKYLKEQRKVFSLFGIEYITDNDKKNIEVICNNILEIQTGCCITDKYYPLETVKTISVESLRLFNAGLANYMSSSLVFSKVSQVFEDESLYMCNVSYSIDTFSGKVVRDSGVVKEYKVPTKLNSNGFIYMGHEYIHSMKDTNFEEYKLSQSLGDVIPLFYEMVSADKFSKLAKSFWNSRLELLKANAVLYCESTDKIKNNIFDRKLYIVSQTMCGQYLNSFYYALILFNLYKENSDYITKQVLMVLGHEMTTLDLLINLGVYNIDSDQVVIGEINKLKKVIK